MTYCTKQDLVDRFGDRELLQLTDRTNTPASTIDDVPVNLAIADATAFINGYLARRYQLPLSSLPDGLTKRAADIARYYLHGKSADEKSAVYLAYSDAKSWLRDVSTGIVVLEAEGIAPSQAGGGTVKANPSGRLFTRDTLRDA